MMIRREPLTHYLSAVYAAQQCLSGGGVTIWQKSRHTLLLRKELIAWKATLTQNAGTVVTPLEHTIAS